jgi:hypothetical protein
MDETRTAWPSGMPHPFAWQPGQAEMAAAGGADRRSAKNAHLPYESIREAHLAAGALHFPRDRWAAPPVTEALNNAPWPDLRDGVITAMRARRTASQQKMTSVSAGHGVLVGRVRRRVGG